MRKNAIKAHCVKAYANNDNFWVVCNNYRHMLEDALEILRVFDGMETGIGKAWLTMKNLEVHVLSHRNPPFT